jgi:hypothetical protein
MLSKINREVSLLSLRRTDLLIARSVTSEFLRLVLTGDVNQIKTYIEDPRRSVDISARGRFGETPLHVAVGDFRQNIPVVDFLLEKGAEKDARDRDGNTPLHIAVLTHNTAALSSLLAVGADTTITDNEGNTARTVAVREREDDLVQLLDSPPYIVPLEPTLGTRRKQKPPPNPTDEELFICGMSEAQMFYFFDKRYSRSTVRVRDLLYSGNGGPLKENNIPKAFSNHQPIRWIHLPANNVSPNPRVLRDHSDWRILDEMGQGELSSLT